MGHPVFTVGEIWTDILKVFFRGKELQYIQPISKLRTGLKWKMWEFYILWPIRILEICHFIWKNNAFRKLLWNASRVTKASHAIFMPLPASEGFKNSTENNLSLILFTIATMKTRLLSRNMSNNYFFTK